MQIRSNRSVKQPFTNNIVCERFSPESLASFGPASGHQRRGLQSDRLEASQIESNIQITSKVHYVLSPFRRNLTVVAQSNQFQPINNSLCRTNLFTNNQNGRDLSQAAVVIRACGHQRHGQQQPPRGGSFPCGGGEGARRRNAGPHRAHPGLRRERLRRTCQVIRWSW